jgi:hypothetical protein
MASPPVSGLFPSSDGALIHQDIKNGSKLPKIAFRCQFYNAGNCVTVLLYGHKVSDDAQILIFNLKKDEFKIRVFEIISFLRSLSIYMKD